MEDTTAGPLRHEVLTHFSCEVCGHTTSLDYFTAAPARCEPEFCGFNSEDDEHTYHAEDGDEGHCLECGAAYFARCGENCIEWCETTSTPGAPAAPERRETMDDMERIALYGRAADCCAIVWETCGDRQAGRDLLALRALAAELAAAPPAPPWLPEPDGPGDWWGGEPGKRAARLTCGHDVFGLPTIRGDGWAAPQAQWLATHPTYRYQRRTPVIVPAEEPAP